MFAVKRKHMTLRSALVLNAEEIGVLGILHLCIVDVLYLGAGIFT